LLKRGLDEILTNNGKRAKLPYIYSTNKSDDSFRKETAPFLSIFTLAADNQLENCARKQPERKRLAQPTEIGNRFFTSVDLVEITEVHETLR